MPGSVYTYVGTGSLSRRSPGLHRNGLSLVLSDLAYTGIVGSQTLSLRPPGLVIQEYVPSLSELLAYIKIFHNKQQEEAPSLPDLLAYTGLQQEGAPSLPDLLAYRSYTGIGPLSPLLPGLYRLCSQSLSPRPRGLYRYNAPSPSLSDLLAYTGIGSQSLSHQPPGLYRNRLPAPLRLLAYTGISSQSLSLRPPGLYRNKLPVPLFVTWLIQE